jgi:phosphomevalonate kinase
MSMTVAFSGKRVSGKDTAAELLVCALTQRLPQTVITITSFARQIKEAFCLATGADLERMLHDRDYKEDHRIALLQFADQRRALMVEQPADMVSHDGILILTDLRTMNELVSLRLKQRQGAAVLLVRIDTGVEARQARGWVWSEAIDMHFTETALDVEVNWDMVVRNDESVPEALDQLHSREGAARTTLVDVSSRPVCDHIC